MKNRKLIAAGLVAVLFSVVVIFCLPFNDHVIVVGKISPNELADAKRAIRREIWKRALPDYSWQSIKNLPREISYYQKRHILAMRVYGGDSIRAIVGPNLGQSKQSLMYEGWYLNRNKQDWHAGLGDMLFPGKELVTPEDFFPELDLTFKPL